MHPSARFARDFRTSTGAPIAYEPDNWQSEMHERFCFWNFADWSQAVEKAGFRVHPDSRAITSPWIVENRYRGKITLFADGPEDLQLLDYPPTNMLLIAEKR